MSSRDVDRTVPGCRVLGDSRDRLDWTGHGFVVPQTASRGGGSAGAAGLWRPGRPPPPRGVGAVGGSPPPEDAPHSSRGRRYGRLKGRHGFPRQEEEGLESSKLND